MGGEGPESDEICGLTPKEGYGSTSTGRCPDRRRKDVQDGSDRITRRTVGKKGFSTTEVKECGVRKYGEGANIKNLDANPFLEGSATSERGKKGPITFIRPSFRKNGPRVRDRGIWKRNKKLENQPYWPRGGRHL